MKEFISRFIIIIIIIVLYPIDFIYSQDYIIGPEDVLTITFWQQPELNTIVRVTSNGMINLPVIGNISVAGFTPTILATKIVDKISLFNRNISQASVIVNEYGSKKIYVNGHVGKPGKYSFEIMPNLWQIILEAGGPAETAILNQVKIIRGGTKTGETVTVDLAKFLKDGDMSELPQIFPGDMIYMPGIDPIKMAGVEGEAKGGVKTAQVSEDVIYIYGQVARPGGYEFNKDLNLLEAIVIAGGPTPAAKLDEVKVIMRGDTYSNVATINLKQYATNGIPAPFILKPGDTIYIPQKKDYGFLLTQGNIFSDVLRIIAATVTSILLYRAIR